MTSQSNANPQEQHHIVQKGWALRQERKQVRFKPHVHEYLRSVFDAGEKTGKKSSAIEVAAKMRLMKDDNEQRIFSPDECLQPSQVVSYFSRLSQNRSSSQKKQREELDDQQTVDSVEDDEYLAGVLKEIEIHELQENIRNELQDSS